MNALRDWRNWLFSAKAFASAMLAFFIALKLDLPNPYWCVTTVYIVANPLSGATRSKALYRALGTTFGAIGAVTLVPVLVDHPLLMSAATSLWVSVLLYLAMLDRTPRGYIFMLGAYTLPIIAMPAVTQPTHIWDIALARTLEIVLGITCAAVVNTVVFPRRMGPLLATRMAQLMDDAGHWTRLLFTPQVSDHATQQLRRRLVGDLAALDAMIRQMAYDAESRTQVAHAQQLRLRIILLIPQAAALHDPVVVLRRRAPTQAAPVLALLEEVLAWMDLGSRGDGDRAKALRARASQLLDTASAANIDHVLMRNAVLRAQEVIDLWQDNLALHRAYAARGTDHERVALGYRNARLSENVLYHDHGLLAWGALSAGMVTFLTCSLWIATANPYGAGAVIMAAVCACFFATADDPRPQQTGFLIWTLVGSLVALVYLFLVLPYMQHFWGLVAVLAPVLLVTGPLVSSPRHALAAVIFPVQAVTIIGLRQTYSADFTHFANASLALVLGMVVLLAWTGMTKPFGTAAVARRLALSTWRDLVRIARDANEQDAARTLSRLLDRSCQLFPREVALREQRMAQLDAVRDLRIALRLLDIRSHRQALTPSSQQALDQLIDAVGDYFQACVDSHHALPAPEHLADQADALVMRLSSQDEPAAEYAAQALAGLRLALFRSPASAQVTPRAASSAVIIEAT
ncbi:FUSC family protein [Oleiagrimonas sp. C23AA]|uniref:FUSC family protein n=1 Tax=Oleiagrimonas sp. C23AA TaxID=2719047 RepID=UPI0014222672|nr:FUSC family protein [Oleiagrimonas sp. C23AA]NII09555.1 FUSC family protein [Oleiagrimonas sp. C23AA]